MIPLGPLAPLSPCKGDDARQIIRLLVLASGRVNERQHFDPEPRSAAAPAARERPDGRCLARGLARAAPGARERGLPRPLRALLHTGLRNPPSPLPAHATDRTGNGAAARYRVQHYRDCLQHRLEQPWYLRTYLPRDHRRKPRGIPRPHARSRACPRAGTRVLPQRGPAAGSQESSFGEASPGGRPYKAAEPEEFQ